MGYAFESVENFESALNAMIIGLFYQREQVFKEDIAQATEECVYSAYTPKSYSRRGDMGGLADPFNNDTLRFDFVPLLKYEMELKNNTPFNGDGGAGSLDELIERGYKYTWARSEIARRQPYPRPFYQKADELALLDLREMVKELESF